MEIWHAPGFWGLAGAFIWAAPEWLAAEFSGKPVKFKANVELAIRLTTGGIAGAAFTPWAVDVIRFAGMHVEPVAALIGLSANTAAPKLAKAVSAVATQFVPKGGGK